MNKPIERPQRSNKEQKSNVHNQSAKLEDTGTKSDNIVTRMTTRIGKLSSLSMYEIKDLVEDTEELGKHLVSDVKTTQIRKFLDATNRLRFNPNRKTNFTTVIKGELQLLRPKLAYAVGRQNKKNKGIEDLKTVIECAIEMVKNPDDFIRFLQLIESIVAYHKFAGGQEQ